MRDVGRTAARARPTRDRWYRLPVTRRSRHTSGRAAWRLVAVFWAGTLLSGVGALWMSEGESASARVDDPSLRPIDTGDTTSPSPPVAFSTVVESTPPSSAAARPNRPVSVPADPYANEPLIEIGTIEIPKIGLSHRLFEGISLRSIDRGPSHWPGSAMPGENGNAVFAGHRVTRTKPFRNIDQLVVGDEVIFTISGERWTYLVTGSEVVTPDALRIVEQTPNATATLFACHPPGSARFRYVVHLALKS